MFAHIRAFTALIEPAGDWVNGSPQLPTGDLTGNYADAKITCAAYDVNACWHSPAVVASS